jgi:hypothetical protein
MINLNRRVAKRKRKRKLTNQKSTRFPFPSSGGLDRTPTEIYSAILGAAFGIHQRNLSIGG